MIEGIKIYTAHYRPGQIMLSAGTERVTMLNGKPTQDPTFVPRVPWRPPTDTELNLLLGEDTNPAYQSVGVVKLPKHVVSLWKKTGVHLARTEQETRAVSRKPTYVEAVKATGQWASTFQTRKDQAIMHNLACIPKGLRTVTHNPKEDRYIGLHLDSWEQKTLGELSSARNRLCINMGQSARYFLFVNQEIQSIQQMLDMPTQGSPRALIRHFLNAYPDYPVIRIKLEPFEAYIAPTENLIHDGSSENQAYQDVQMTLRSYFSVIPPRMSLLQRVKQILHAH